MLTGDEKTRVERMEQRLLEEVTRAHQRAAMRFLSVVQDACARRNLRRHELKFATGMGTNCITIDGNVLDTFSGPPPRGIYLLLIQVLSLMDNDWAYCLDGFRLNFDCVGAHRDG